MNGDNLLHFYYHFCSSVGIAEVPQDVVSCIGQSYWPDVVCSASSWRTEQNSQKRLVFSETRAGSGVDYSAPGRL